ncbi:unnamed protein product, partial [Symbiodinium sp. CCMP2592]
MLGKPGLDHVVGPTGWRYGLMEAITEATGDPDTDVAAWFRDGAPLKILNAIPNRGMFPEAGLSEAQRASQEYYEARGAPEGRENYRSFEEFASESEEELQRLVREGHLERIGEWEDVVARWPDAITTRIATIVKERPDGTAKTRFVVDMRRSGIKGLATKFSERIVLPRGCDAVEGILDLLRRRKPGEEVYLITVDIADAFLNLQVREEERAYTIVRGQDGTYYAYKGVPFGLATAPLLWGRVAAWLMRFIQASMARDRASLQCYVDDPLAAVRGTAREATHIMLMMMVAFSVVGARLAIKKLAAGPSVQAWIGSVLSVEGDAVRIRIHLDKAKTLKLLHRVLGGRAVLGRGHRPEIAALRLHVVGSSRCGPTAADQHGESGDASTTGLGGILLSTDGRPLRYWAATITEEVAQFLGARIGESSSMTTFELLALFVGLKVWGPRLFGKRLGVQIQMDNQSALTIATALSSKGDSSNHLAAEISLLLESLQVKALDLRHWRNTINIEA